MQRQQVKEKVVAEEQMNVFVLWLLTVTDIVLYPEAAGGESASQGADVCLCLDTV